MDCTTIPQKWLDKLLDMLEEHLGPDSEIVLHDLSLNLEHTIVDIRNSYITGRKLGDSIERCIGMELTRGGLNNGDRYNYITHTRDAKLLRSSSAFFRDEDGKVVAALSISTNITESIKFENYLHKHNHYSSEPATDTGYPGGVKQLLEHFIQEGQHLVGKPVSLMSREDKMTVIKYLDDVGAFLITKSGDRICEFLGISRYSLYHYLDSMRGHDSHGNEL